MKLRKTAAIYSIVVGLAMIGAWIMLFMTGQDAELQNSLQTEPITLGLHLAAEFLTSIVLLVAGIGLFTDRSWAVKVFLLSIGFLTYSVVNAAGFYAQRGDLPFISMFAAIFTLALIFSVLALRTTRDKNASKSRHKQ